MIRVVVSSIPFQSTSSFRLRSRDPCYNLESIRHDHVLLLPEGKLESRGRLIDSILGGIVFLSISTKVVSWPYHNNSDGHAHSGPISRLSGHYRRLVDTPGHTFGPWILEFLGPLDAFHYKDQKKEPKMTKTQFLNMLSLLCSNIAGPNYESTDQASLSSSGNS